MALLSACGDNPQDTFKNEQQDAPQDKPILDQDNDGIPDSQDMFPLNPNEFLDTDNDGLGNNLDPDDDNDGISDELDLFPLDPTRGADLSGGTDSDNDGISDEQDAFPNDGEEIMDSDQDGIGNNQDNDDDNDGVLDGKDMNPLDPSVGMPNGGADNSGPENDTSDNMGNDQSEDDSQLPALTTWTIPVSQDSYVHKKNPESIFGDSETLLSKLTSANSDYSRESYLQFDLSALPISEISGDVTAELFIHQKLNGDIVTAPVININLTEGDWSEDILNWENKPAMRETITQTSIPLDSLDNPAWHKILVSSAVNIMLEEGDTQLSLSLSNPENVILSVSSKEYHAGVFAAFIKIQATHTPIDESDPDTGGETNENTETDTGSNPDTDGDSNPGTDQDTDQGTDTDNSGSTDESNQASALQGQLLYQQQCASCHGDNADGEPDGLSLLSSLHTREFVPVTLNTMPYGNPGACDTQCATDIQAWLKTLHTNQDNTNTDDETLDNSQTLAATQQRLLSRLYKASMNLNSTLPLNNWVENVMEDGQSGFESSVDKMMNEDAFYQRLKEIYQPYLHTTSSASGSYVATFGGDVDWHETFNDNAKAKYARNAGNNALNDGALELISYVAKHNRPFTEILTADYMLLNYFSARLLNRLDSVEFTPIEDAQYSDLAFSENEFKKVKINDVPLAGVLTSHAFIRKYPTTTTNVNRHRSYHVFKQFLDTDIFEISGSRVETDDIASDNPTMNNPTCTGCHNVMDPVSSSFRHWQRRDERNATPKSWDQSQLLPPGFNGEEMPEDESAPLQWLTQRIASDPRFARATVKTLFQSITGHPLLLNPDQHASQLATQRYNYQQSIIQQIASDFIGSNYNIKQLIKALIMSDYFNSETFVGGSSQLLPSERLTRKLKATLNDSSFSGSNTLLSSSVYQGDQANGIMTLIQQYTASYGACESLKQDLAKMPTDRILLPEFNWEGSLQENGNLSEQAHESIKLNLQNLMWVLWGQAVETDDESLVQLYDHYLSVVAAGQSDSTTNSLNGNCRFNDPVSDNQVRYDNDYLIRGWIGMINIMIDDYRFYFE